MTRDTTIHHRPSVSDEIETKLSQLNLNTEEDGLDLDNSPSDSESEDDVNSQQAKIKQQREAQKNKFKSWSALSAIFVFGLSMSDSILGYLNKARRLLMKRSNLQFKLRQTMNSQLEA